MKGKSIRSGVLRVVLAVLICNVLSTDRGDLLRWLDGLIVQQISPVMPRSTAPSLDVARPTHDALA
jgi:hypothetical protein